VGPPAAAIDAWRHDFHWGSSSLKVVDQVRSLCIWLTSCWSWDTHIAAAFRKGLRAFHSWRPVLMSSRFSVAAKLRIIHPVIRPVLENGMEVWAHPRGPQLGSAGVVTLGLIPHSSSLTTFFCLPVAWLAGSPDFAARLAGLGVRVCSPQSF
jgi:hypothetical protein